MLIIPTLIIEKMSHGSMINATMMKASIISKSGLIQLILFQFLSVVIAIGCIQC